MRVCDVSIVREGCGDEQRIGEGDREGEGEEYGVEWREDFVGGGADGNGE